MGGYVQCLWISEESMEWSGPRVSSICELPTDDAENQTPVCGAIHSN